MHKHDETLQRHAQKHFNHFFLMHFIDFKVLHLIRVSFNAIQIEIKSLNVQIMVQTQTFDDFGDHFGLKINLAFIFFVFVRNSQWKSVVTLKQFNFCSLVFCFEFGTFEKNKPILTIEPSNREL